MVSWVATDPGVSFACAALAVAPTPSELAPNRSSAAEDGSGARSFRVRSALSSRVIVSRTLGSSARRGVLGTAPSESATTPTIATHTNAQAEAISFQSRENRFITSATGPRVKVGRFDDLRDLCVVCQQCFDVCQQCFDVDDRAPELPQSPA